MTAQNGYASAENRSYRATSFALEGLEGRQLLSSVALAGRHHHVTTPAAPTQLTATAATTQVRLNWVDNASNETSYVVLRKTSKHGKYSVVASLPANTIYFRNRGLTPGQNYWYAVEAENTAGASGAAVVFFTAPAATSTPPPLNPAVGAISLDRTFNGTGELVDPSLQGAERMAVQADGKILVLALDGAGGIYGTQWLQRYNADGSLDRTFGNQGRVSFPSLSPDRGGLAVVAGGKILIAGSASATNDLNEDVVVYRLNTDGSTDTSFGTNGMAVGAFGQNEFVADLAVAPDGKIIVGGSDGNNASSPNLFAVRFTAAGALDTSFGSGGIARDRVSLNLENYLTAYAVAVDPNDGSAIVVGRNLATTPFQLSQGSYTLQGRRFTPSGGVTRFSFDGGASEYFPRSVTVQPDSKIIVASSFGGSEADLFRFNPDGSYDASFTGNSKGSPSGGNGAYGYETALRLSNGSYLAGGFSFPTSNNSDFVLTRITSAGSADPTAGGTGGVLSLELGAGDEVIESLAIEPDGSVIAAGTSGGHLALLRFRTG